MASDDEPTDPHGFPVEPIHRITGPLGRYLHVEALSGILLLAAAIVAFWAANSPFADAYLGFWKTPIAFEIEGWVDLEYALKHWINDGLMAIFFFVVGLEVKRELVLGRLREMRNAILPLAAAIGGMVVPALLYLWLLWGEPTAHGWGIPMATDIAFVVGCMALLGPRVPAGLRVLMLTLAIVDDIGAILVIAIGYTTDLQVGMLGLGMLGIGVILLMQKAGVRAVPGYTVVGAFIWLAFHESGVHATIAGVILGLMTPAHSWISEGRFGEMGTRARELWTGAVDAAQRRMVLDDMQRAARETVSPLERLEKGVHPWSAFVIMPIFALTNAAVPVNAELVRDPLALAVGVGLVIGKPLGIVLFSFIAIRMGLAALPEGVSWRMLAAGGCLGGIGFTMSLFIAALAVDRSVLDAARVGVLIASVISGVIGMLLLRFLPQAPAEAAR